MDLLKYLNKNSILEKKSFEILIVDDNIPFARYLEEVLKKNYRNYKITVLNKPESVIEKLSSKRVDLLILDINMPNMSGVECAVEFNKFFNFKIPILFISANKNAESLVLKSGVTNLYSFMSKPVNESKMFENIEKLLRIKSI